MASSPAPLSLLTLHRPTPNPLVEPLSTGDVQFLLLGFSPQWESTPLELLRRKVWCLWGKRSAGQRL